ncbi:glycosyl transferases group 1-domain-containing protein [Jimgerdemannia flammicorona]|uniref:Chitobiosyldiphosphodolichol beta-mannosyltransferase n=1 Tax=Jimgerdemannia flammicorona TaxID=994334 RepID=A0A433A2Y9_9FUNG|nr:glycosyl transferases group 1-domain-containing protein [Jimgerdemannia flammicorona]
MPSLGISIRNIHFLLNRSPFQFLKRIEFSKAIESQILNARDFLGDISQPETTLLTIKHTSTTDAEYRTDRPQLIVSSTSWTEDEDFTILLDAMQKYETVAAASVDPATYPKLLFVITGKGSLKTYYEQKISKMQLNRTRIVTLWLEMIDYPLLLGSADLGISLHKSTSGMDLPMKVVDMFGCGLPVCALGFDCIDELVHNDENGLIFKDAAQLSEHHNGFVIPDVDCVLKIFLSLFSFAGSLRHSCLFKETRVSARKCHLRTPAGKLGEELEGAVAQAVH